MNKFLVAAVVSSSFILFGGCSFRTNEKPAWLIIAIENLAPPDTICLRDWQEGKSGFEILCRESIRYTHAFTPSTYSPAALVSALSGLEPFEHGINGFNSYVPMKTETLAEALKKQSWRTLFFSGGAPVLRNLGLNQGFELFDDSLATPYSKSLGLSLTRLQDLWDSRFPLFAVVYASDLLFEAKSTTDLNGETRSLSYESQLEELDSQLFYFLNNLKKKNLYNSAQIVLFGLNSKSNLRPELKLNNVFADRTQVALFVKPKRPQKDSSPLWNIDRNISLTDLGVTLQRLLNPENLNTQSYRADADLSQDWTSLGAVKPKDKIIITQGWSQHSENVESDLIAFREKQWLWVSPRNGGKSSVFNTLTDRNESHQWKNRTTESLKSFMAKAEELRKDKFKAHASSMARTEFLLQEPIRDILWTPPLSQKRRQDLSQLESASEAAQSLLVRELLYFQPRYQLKSTHPCGLIVTEKESRFCDDELAVAFARAQRQGLSAAEKFKSFSSQWIERELDRRRYELNFLFNGIWNLSIKELQPLEGYDYLLAQEPYLEFKQLLYQGNSLRTEFTEPK